MLMLTSMLLVNRWMGRLGPKRIVVRDEPARPVVHSHFSTAAHRHPPRGPTCVRLGPMRRMDAIHQTPRQTAAAAEFMLFSEQILTIGRLACTLLFLSV